MTNIIGDVPYGAIDIALSMAIKQGLFVNRSPAMFNYSSIRIKAEIVATTSTGLVMLSINCPPIQMAK